MRLTFKNLRLLYLSFLLPIFVHSQDQTSAEANTSLLLTDANTYYTRQELADPLFNGRIHRGFSPAIENTGFLDSNGWQKGNIVYQHKLFRDRPLRFDAITQTLVIRSDNGFPIAIRSEQIDSFTMGSHFFVRQDQDLQGSLPGGFYEILNEGKAVIYCQRKKIYYEAIQGRELYRAYLPAYKYYILLNGTFTPVQSRGKLIALLGGNASLYKRKLREKNLTWKSNMEQSIKTIVATYNQQP